MGEGGKGGCRGDTYQGRERGEAESKNDGVSEGYFVFFKRKHTFNLSTHLFLGMCLIKSSCAFGLL